MAQYCTWLTCGARPELSGLPHKRVKPQLECLYRGTFSTAPGCARGGLVPTSRLPRQVPRDVQLWTDSTVCIKIGPILELANSF